MSTPSTSQAPAQLRFSQLSAEQRQQAIRLASADGRPNCIGLHFTLDENGNVTRFADYMPDVRHGIAPHMRHYSTREDAEPRSPAAITISFTAAEYDLLKTALSAKEQHAVAMLAKSEDKLSAVEDLLTKVERISLPTRCAQYPLCALEAGHAGPCRKVTRATLTTEGGAL